MIAIIDGASIKTCCILGLVIACKQLGNILAIIQVCNV
jgi:hypothetical protein